MRRWWRGAWASQPCVVGAGQISIDYDAGVMRVGEHEIRRGHWITVDGSTGRALMGQVQTVQPEMGAAFQTFMQWADSYRDLRVRANADNGHDAAAVRELGAEGIGLCRTEHMFMGEERLAIVREMILADDLAGREQTLERLLSIQRGDFYEIFKAMDGLPVTIRLLDPPLHEFLPDQQHLQTELADLKLQLQRATSFLELDRLHDDPLPSPQFCVKTHPTPVPDTASPRGCQ